MYLIPNGNTPVSITLLEMCTIKIYNHVIVTYLPSNLSTHSNFSTVTHTPFTHIISGDLQF
jgi:hypothetical protein